MILYWDLETYSAKKSKSRPDIVSLRFDLCRVLLNLAEHDPLTRTCPVPTTPQLPVTNIAGHRTPQSKSIIQNGYYNESTFRVKESSKN